MDTRKIQARRRVVLPDGFMDKHDLQVGDKVAMVNDGNNLIVVPEGEAEQRMVE